LKKSIRVLLVDDYSPFRSSVRSMLEKLPDFEVAGEASDGMDAIQKAQELRPDLILLDISLPRLNGIAVARRIREFSPKARILFVSANRDWEMAADVLDAAPTAYVVKSAARRDLLPAIASVLQGKNFVSPSLLESGLNASACVPIESGYDKFGTLISRWSPGDGCCHQAGFYNDDRSFIDDVKRFIGTALKAGNAAIVVATEAHRKSLFLSLSECDLDVTAGLTQGRYIAVDAAEALSTFMIDGMPDPLRFREVFGDFILKARAVATVERPRVAIFGECVNLLAAEGHHEALIQIEKLANQLVNAYEIDILCGYSLNDVHGLMDGHIYQLIRAEHAAVHSR